MDQVIIKTYKRHLKSRGLQDDTIKTYLWHLQKFLSWLGQKKWDKKTQTEYYNLILKQYKKIGTINLHFKIANDWLNSKKQKNLFVLLSHRPQNKIILSKSQLNVLLTWESRKNSISAARDRALINILCQTGIKPKQIINFRRKIVDQIQNSLVIDAHEIYFLPPSAWRSLITYLEKRNDDEPWLFINFDRAHKSRAGTKLSIRSVERITENYGRHAGLGRKISPQILRDSYAFYQKNYGAQVKDLQLLLKFKSQRSAYQYWQKL